MAKTNLTTFFENGLLAPFLNTAKNQTTQDRMTRLYSNMESNYEIIQKYNNQDPSTSNINLFDLLKNQPKYKEINQPRIGKRILYPVARYITTTFPSILAIPKDAADHIYWNEFDNIVYQLLKGPPRNIVGRENQYYKTYGWDESLEEKLPQDFIVNETSNPPNMKIFAFKRKLVKYKNPVKSREINSGFY